MQDDCLLDENLSYSELMSFVHKGPVCTLMTAVICISELIYAKYLETCLVNTMHHGNIWVVVIVIQTHLQS